MPPMWEFQQRMGFISDGTVSIKKNKIGKN
jgi:hypothetical protein